ncbi:8-amino-7-oxononanoate synthase [Legionella lansingensis]|uniref:8-amino-7-oxononanoate synthase n=1 Tax=Legionella lansingensis TaxID=45067 RepID=A0A0W0VTY3_9GAMM|nr:8-amino-7-oxononanoate synthase [Legionella lansingensis]KTD23437.1 8-amino-7-oxononanoate synthase [Legionella lansingensis]SNV50908.1 8-amino-7-oxononanoate synthase [Legionella lansingensis]
MLNDLVVDYCNQLLKKGLYRQRRLAPEIDEGILNFSSSDYLSLTQDPRIKQAFQRGFQKYPSGSGGSMVVCGYHTIHRELESTFAQRLGADDALLFSSGYAANLGVVSMLARLGAHLYIDKCIHASFYDGIRLSRPSFTRFLHNNLQDLQEKLAAIKPNPVILTEGVFSMSGQMVSLEKMKTLCENVKAELIVDEAHAFGVQGHQGLGAAHYHQLTQKEVVLRIVPFGKAFGCQGAMVVGRKEWIDALLQSARSNIYSTGVSPAIAYGLLETLNIVLAADDRRQKLFQLINYFQQAIKTSPLTWRHSKTPIQQLQLNCPHKALYYANALRDKAIFCSAMREPTVSKKDTGLRIILNYQHEPKDIDRLLSQLHYIYETEH